MRCKQAPEYAQIKCNQSKFMSLLPLLVCFSSPRNFNPSPSFNVAPSLSMSNFYFSPWCISYLCSNFSPFVINFHKRCASYWYKWLQWGKWLILESCIFYGHHHKCWNDTTCIAIDIPHVGSLTLMPIGVGHLPLCPSMCIHLIILSSC